jgi:hypothetical protein
MCTILGKDRQIQHTHNVFAYNNIPFNVCGILGMNSDYWLVLPEKVPFSIKGLNLSKLIMNSFCDQGASLLEISCAFVVES